MLISVKVHPRSREESIEKLENGSYVVRVRAPAERGKANAALVKLLSKYFDAEVRIVSGFTSRDKTLEVT